MFLHFVIFWIVVNLIYHYLLYMLMAQAAAMKNFQKQQAQKQSRQDWTNDEKLLGIKAINVQSLPTEGTKPQAVVMPDLVPALNAKRIDKPIQCWNCGTPISKGISKSEKNPERVYIRCPLANVYPMCGEFFIWDDATQEELRQSVRIWREKINKQAYMEEAQKRIGPPPAAYTRKRKANGETDDTNRFPITVGPDAATAETIKSILDTQEIILSQLVQVAKHIKLNPTDHQTTHDAQGTKSPHTTSSTSNVSSVGDINDMSSQPNYDDE